LPLLFLAASFASSSETAFFSLDRFELKRLKERHKGAHAHIKTLLEHPTRLLIIILMINELANLTIANAITRFFARAIPANGAGDERRFMIISLCSLLVAAPLTLLFGEITPKVLAARMNRLIAALNSRPLIVVYKLLKPVLAALDFIISAALRPLGGKTKSHLSKFMSPLDEADFMAIMEEAQKEGSLEPLEKKLIQKVFHLDDTAVTHVMVPISKAFVVNEKSKVSDVMDEIRREKYSRVPAYAKNRKHITGILYVKDLLQLDFDPALPEKRVGELTAKPMFVQPTINLAALLRRFRKTKTHLAVVADKQGAALGIISLEDVLESIFGRIEDERDHDDSGGAAP
jgi:CBS domain containing-hemolysin-like protein